VTSQLPPTRAPELILFKINVVAELESWGRISTPKGFASRLFNVYQTKLRQFNNSFLANQANPQQFFLGINVFCRPKIFWMVQASGRDVDFIGATFRFVSERRSARIAESSKCAGVGFVSMRFAALPLKVGRLHDDPGHGLGASCAPAIFAMTIRA
jgi:hypothetical protein